MAIFAIAPISRAWSGRMTKGWSKLDDHPNEDWLHELSIDMFAEDGCLRVYGVGEDGVTAFTDYDIECLKQTIASGNLTND